MIWLELQVSLCSASSCLSHIDLGTENGAGHATIMTTATDDLAINNSLAAIGSTRNLYNSQKSKLYVSFLFANMPFSLLTQLALWNIFAGCQQQTKAKRCVVMPSPKIGTYEKTFCPFFLVGYLLSER